MSSAVAILDVHRKNWNTVNTSRRYGKSRECDSKIWEERHFKLHGFDIYGSLNGKEVSRYATSNDETHELCDLHEGS
ncbi:hypothetical protein Dimus_030215 [Dionaea muscipula]